MIDLKTLQNGMPAKDFREGINNNFVGVTSEIEKTKIQVDKLNLNLAEQIQEIANNQKTNKSEILLGIYKIDDYFEQMNTNLGTILLNLDSVMNRLDKIEEKLKKKPRFFGLIKGE